MRKSLICCYMFIFFILIGTCYAASSEERILKLEDKIRELEQSLRILQGTGGRITQSVVPAATQEAARLELGTWGYKHIDEGVTDYYNITLELINRYDAGIKATDATLYFFDQEGYYLFGIKITPDLNIPPNGNIKDTGLYRLNRYLKSHHRMATMKTKDVTPKLNIQKIVFYDNIQIYYRPVGTGKDRSDYDVFPVVEKQQ